MSKIPSDNKLAVYYGLPSAVNDTFKPELSAKVFSQYDQVVFGPDLENPKHPDHDNTRQIIADPQMQKTKVFGSINSSDDFESVNQTNIKLWKEMGVAGVFCAQFGYDFKISRRQQNQLVDFIHSLGMLVFVTAAESDDVFGNIQNEDMNPDRTATHMTRDDWYLIEGFQIDRDIYADGTEFVAMAAKVASYSKASGVKIAGITTTESGEFNQDKWDYAYYSALAYGFDACGWGEQNYSSETNKLPFRARKPYLGNARLSTTPLVQDNFISTHTNIGFSINLLTHKVSQSLTIWQPIR
jgi:hypothetical protein